MPINESYRTAVNAPCLKGRVTEREELPNGGVIEIDKNRAHAASA